MASRTMEMYDRLKARNRKAREGAPAKPQRLMEAGEEMPDMPAPDGAPLGGGMPAGPMPGAEGPGGTPGPGGAPKEAVQQYNTIWLSAKEFFDQKADELIDLPRESEDRLLVDAATGLMAEYEVKPEENPTPDHIRDTASLLADRMDQLFGERDADDELKSYAVKFAQSMREFHNQIEPGGGDAPAPEPEGKPEEPATPDPNEEPKPDFHRDMANELPNPPTPAPAPRQESCHHERKLCPKGHVAICRCPAPKHTVHIQESECFTCQRTGSVRESARRAFTFIR